MTLMMDRKQLKKWGHWIVLIAMFGIVALVFQQIATSFTEQGVASGDALSNAALFPRYVAITIAVLGAIVAVQMVVNGTPEEEPIDAAGPAVDKSESESPVRLRLQELAVMLLTLAYLILLVPLGFHLTTFLVIGSMFYVLGARPLHRVVLASAGLVLVCSLVFEGLLKVVLPLGFMNLTIPYHLLGL